MLRIRTGRSTAMAAGALFVALVIAACDKKAADQTDTPAASRNPAATPAQRKPSNATIERPVDSEALPYADVNEELAYGYFAFPSDMAEPLPAMLLVHDWWGLNEDMRAAANRLAAAGYMVLAVDLFGGDTLDDAAAAREKTIQVVENPSDVDENLRQALEFVDVAGAPAVGIVGWGFGGSFALNTALRFPERINAVVVFYGQVPDNSDRLATLEAPVLGLFGAEDRTVTPKSVSAFADATYRLGNPAEVEIYDGAAHGFADPKRSRYDAAIATRAWQRMLDFLAATLVVTEES